MTALFSYWSAPEVDSVNFSGWASPSDRDAGWMLSTLLARKTFEKLRFIGDPVGCDMVTRLKLPFDSVETFDSSIDGMPSTLWSTGKLVALRQSLPWLRDGETTVHLDHDVFLLNGFPEEWFEGRPAIFQSAEHFDKGFGFYSPVINAFVSLAHSGQILLPSSFNNGCGLAFNCGVIGLRPEAAAYVERWCDEALFLCAQMSRHNEWISKIPLCWPVIPEQFVAAAVAHEMGIEPAWIMEDSRAPDGYVHLIGRSKRAPDATLRIHNRLARDFPAAATLHRSLHSSSPL